MGAPSSPSNVDPSPQASCLLQDQENLWQTVLLTIPQGMDTLGPWVFHFLGIFHGFMRLGSSRIGSELLPGKGRCSLWEGAREQQWGRAEGITAPEKWAGTILGLLPEV